MTHPFHPLHGKELEIIDRSWFEDGESLHLEVEPGRVERLPAAWTNIGPADVFVAVSAGRSLFRVDDLVRLVELIAGTGPGPRPAAVQGGAGDV